MPSFDKTRDASMEAGLPLNQRNGAIGEKDQARESTSSQPDTRPRMSSRRRFFVMLLVFSFFAFTLMRGMALMTLLCMHERPGRGIQAELVEDEAISNALNSLSLEELCKVYAEYCPEEMRPSSDSLDEPEASSEAESAVSGLLGKRQDNGSNSTAGPQSTPSVPEEPSTSNPPSRTSSSAVPPSSTVSTSSEEEPPSSALTSSQNPPRQTSTSGRTTTTQAPTSASPTSSDPESSPVETSSVESTSERPASSSDAEDTTSSRSSSSSRRVITTGTISTSSAERHVFTTTLPDGAPTTLTSTSWVEYVPAGPTGSQDDPELQGSASGWQRSTLLQVVMGVLVGGILMV